MPQRYHSTACEGQFASPVTGYGQLTFQCDGHAVNELHLILNTLP